MKLKKLLALALAGVMAVSMLAGCKGDNGNNGNDGEEENVISGAAAVVNHVYGGNVTFTDGTASYLNATIAYNSLNSVDDLDALELTGGIVKTIKQNMTVAAFDKIKENFEDFDTTVSKKEDLNKEITVIYAVDAEDIISTEQLMIELGTELKTDLVVKDVVNVDADSYLVSYAGTVSVQKVSAVSGTETAEVYLIAVTVTRTAGAQVSV